MGCSAISVRPAAPTENITLDHPRPDAPLYPGPIAIAIPTIQAVLTGPDGQPIIDTHGNEIALAPPVSQILPSNPWTPNTAYAVNAEVTAGNPVGTQAVGQEFYRFVCIMPGKSGPAAPAWTDSPATEVLDGTVLWFNIGLYLLDQAATNNANR